MSDVSLSYYQRWYRDWETLEDAKQKCGQLLPQYPDENTIHMESWEIVTVESGTGTIHYSME